VSKHIRERQIAEHIQKDPFAVMLHASTDIVGPGHAKVTMTVTESMCNFHGTIHGGIIFTICDIAFGAACNSHGRTAVAMDVNINFIRAAKPGDCLVAEAIEQYQGGKTALYDISIKDKNSEKLVARFQGRAYLMDEWFVPAAENTD
jgi:acyl-CoA thioesterase